MNVRAHVFVSGKVQGVFFRQQTKRKAQSLGVSGWVKNLKDGRVEAVFEGEETSVNLILEFCRRGPIGASVTSVSVNWEPIVEAFDGFEIVY